MRYTVILRVSYFLQVKVVKVNLQAKVGHFFRIKKIHSDLMNLQQGLNDNNYYG
jgi:hypothetical protein